MPPLNLNDAERIKELIVAPVIEGLEARIVGRLANLESSDVAQAKRLDQLEGNQQKALWGYAAIVGGGRCCSTPSWRG
jgi:hypothetical protein